MLPLPSTRTSSRHMSRRLVQKPFPVFKLLHELSGRTYSASAALIAGNACQCGASIASAEGGVTHAVQFIMCTRPMETSSAHTCILLSLPMSSLLSPAPHPCAPLRLWTRPISTYIGTVHKYAGVTPRCDRDAQFEERVDERMAQTSSPMSQPL